MTKERIKVGIRLRETSTFPPVFPVILPSLDIAYLSFHKQNDSSLENKKHDGKQPNAVVSYGL